MGFDMESVQRLALIVRPTRRYVDWANSLDHGPRLSLSEARARPSVYLVNAVTADALSEDRYALPIFEAELESCTADESKWPANRTARLFHSWFEVAAADSIWDLDGRDAMFHDEVSGECGWCGRQLGDGDFVVTVTLVRAPGAPVPAPGPLELPAPDRTISAIVPLPDSESGRLGAGALILLCSHDCASNVRAALGLGRQMLAS